MKLKKLRLMIPFLFMVIGMSGCEDEKNEYSDLFEGYVVGSFICDETGNNGQATENRTERGFCILIEGSENIKSHWPMDFYTFNLPNNLFDFPEELLPPGSNGKDCGPFFFPEEVRYLYKIKFKYRILDETEKNKFACGPCLAMDLSFPWDNYREISLKDVIKN
jgi:hypothetical protein